jgi:hypothetical protein
MQSSAGFESTFKTGFHILGNRHHAGDIWSMVNESVTAA